MKNRQVYRIKKGFLLPLLIIVICLFVLSWAAIFSSVSAGEKILLPALFLVTLIFCLDKLTRRVSLSEKGLKLVKFFRTKELPWGDINHVGGLNLKNKRYLLLTTNRGFFFFSDNMERFSQLSSEIVSGVGKERVEQEVLDQLEEPEPFPWTLLYYWGALLLVILLTFFRLTYL